MVNEFISYQVGDVVYIESTKKRRSVVEEAKMKNLSFFGTIISAPRSGKSLDYLIRFVDKETKEMFDIKINEVELRPIKDFSQLSILEIMKLYGDDSIREYSSKTNKGLKPTRKEYK